LLRSNRFTAKSKLTNFLAIKHPLYEDYVCDPLRQAGSIWHFSFLLNFMDFNPQTD